MKAGAYTLTADKGVHIRPLITCFECRHKKPSVLKGYWYCEAWDRDLNGEKYNERTYFCAEGDRDDEA